MYFNISKLVSWPMGLLVTLLLVACAAKDAKQSEVQLSAESFAVNWLSYLDHSEFQKAWDMTTEEYRVKWSFNEWASAMKESRVILADAPNARQVHEVTMVDKLPDYGISGQFAILEVYTKENTGDIFEDTVVLKKEEGKWMVIGNGFWRNSSGE